MKTKFLITSVFLGISISPSWVFAKTLDELVDLAIRHNPTIAAAKENFKAESSLVAAKATLSDPMIGFSSLNRNMRTQYGTITQKIKFPVKYYIEAKAQNSRASSHKTLKQAEVLRVRKEVTSLYYGIYSTQKIIQLTRANMQAVKEFARVAEKKYAAGKAPQGDSMKAHFELTQLELDLIRLKQQEEALQDQLEAVVNYDKLSSIDLSSKDLGVPDFRSHDVEDSIEKLTPILQSQSPRLKSELHLLDAAEWKGALGKWEFAPDFQFQFQQRIGGQPNDSQIYSIGMTFPLWFWKKGSEASAATSRRLAQEYRVRSTTLGLIANVKTLKGRVVAGSKTLKVYKTSLIPQAQGAYNSARASYRANKTSFLDLLDSERSLYRVKTGFYRSLRQYVESLSQLEANLGFSVSNLSQAKEVSNEE